MKTGCFLPLTFAAACTVVPCTASETQPTAPSERVLKFLGSYANSVIAEATRIEVFRLDQSMSGSRAAEEISGYPVISTGKAPEKQFAARLAAILLDEKTYLFDMAPKSCEPNPGVAFRLWKGTRHVDVVLSFECDMLLVNPWLGFAHFDPARPALVRLVKEALPDDPEIQKLPEKGKE